MNEPPEDEQLAEAIARSRERFDDLWFSEDWKFYDELSRAFVLARKNTRMELRRIGISPVMITWIEEWLQKRRRRYSNHNG